jgi:hypothetical protein
MASKIENGHGLLFLSQIVAPSEEATVPKSKMDKVVESCSSWGFNFSLPVVCLTDEEERYHLLTGLPIYEAAKKAGLTRIWVFLVASKKQDAEKVIEEVQLQSSLNERLIGSQDLEEFRKFLNDESSPLKSVSGIKDGNAKLIKNHRPFNSIEDMHKKLGLKRCANWLKAYKKSIA